jgi:hypothetical protein
MSKFYSEENLKLLVNIAKKYLDDKYSFAIDKEEDKEIKRLIYETMTGVEEDCANRPNITFEKKNIAVLNSVKEVYIKKYKLTTTESSKKPNMQNLSRDTELFGNRPMKVNTIVPEIDSYQRKTNINAPNSNNNRLLTYNADFDKKPEIDISKLGVVTKETPEENEIFMKKLKELEDQRSMLNIDIPPPPESMDELTLQLQLQNQNAKTNTQNQKYSMLELEDTQSKPKLATSPTNSPKNTYKMISKFININSQDRSWWNDYPLRYQYGIDLPEKYTNISTIGVGKVIIPESTFDYPYLILKINEFKDLYGKLIFNKSYETKNKRGYIILEPELNQKISYSGELNKLNINILKPNGDLFNRSSDNYYIVSIQVFDGSLKIITTKNDFMTGDNILFKKVICDTNNNEFISFINSYHEIIEVSDDNTFYIDCPLSATTELKIGNITGQIINISLQHSITLHFDVVF